jgi:hypothetical protein
MKTLAVEFHHGLNTDTVYLAVYLIGNKLDFPGSGMRNAGGKLK